MFNIASPIDSLQGIRYADNGSSRPGDRPDFVGEESPNSTGQGAG
jgi:hypothetical protein